MYIHLGLDKIVKSEDIVGIFDLDNTTIQKSSRNFLARSEKSGQVENVCTDLPKSYVICEKDGVNKVYITQISTLTLLKRCKSKGWIE